MHRNRLLPLNLPPDAPLRRRAAFALARPFLAALLGARELRRLYLRAQADPGDRFATRVLRAMNVRTVISNPDGIPATGPLLIIANHPHGLLDGLLLADVVGAVRNDVRMVGNQVLSVVPELNNLCFFVDPFEGPRRAARSYAGLRATQRWLLAGGAVIVFPAGEVAHRATNAGPTREDSPWHRAIAGLALSTRATVLPVFIEGCNTKRFYAAGRLHPLLRSMLLPRELLKQAGRRVSVQIGSPIPSTTLASLAGDAKSVTGWLRERVDALGARGPEERPSGVAIAPAVDPRELEAEVRRLPRDAQLLQSGELEVYCAEASRMPRLLNEIGRLRELTFRAVGEGTGNEKDLDRFDAHYLHLFVWNRERREIAGAYRLGRADTVIARHGIEGLYTSTLFRYDERLLARISPALELGRSFVRAEYQRNSSALMLLWKGIGRFVVSGGRYRVLFGPVSISSRYADVSQQLLMSFLEQNHKDQELAELVAAMQPPERPTRGARAVGDSVTGARDIDRTIAALEGDGKGIPVLLRHYLRLNARLLGFNVDPAFGDALDALMAVDLARVEPAILRRYLGPEGVALFSRGEMAA